MSNKIAVPCDFDNIFTHNALQIHQIKSILAAHIHVYMFDDAYGKSLMAIYIFVPVITNCMVLMKD